MVRSRRGRHRPEGRRRLGSRGVHQLLRRQLPPAGWSALRHDRRSVRGSGRRAGGVRTGLGLSRADRPGRIARGVGPRDGVADCCLPMAAGARGDDAACRARPLAADDVIRRGQRRHRRSIVGRSFCALSVAGAVAAVVLAMTALVPAGHQPTAQLAAWTVVKQADGNISVTIRELKDPAGLQRTLRADGVPASVTLVSQQNEACQPYPGGTPRHGVTPLLKRVFPVPYENLSLTPPPAQPTQGPPPAPPSSSIVVIDPSALPGTPACRSASAPTAGLCS